MNSKLKLILAVFLVSILSIATNANSAAQIEEKKDKNTAADHKKIISRADSQKIQLQKLIS